VLKEEKKMLGLQLKALQDLTAARAAVERRTVGVGDCTVNDSFGPDNDRLLHRTPNGDFASDIQVIRKVKIDSLPPPVAKKPCRSIGVGDGDVFALSVALASSSEVPPGMVRVHEKELNTEQKTEVHEKEIKTIFLDKGQEVPTFVDRPQVPTKPKPLTRSVGVGDGNVFESTKSDSESFQVHEKELRTVYIGGDGASQKERKVTRNVGILCKAAMRDVGVTYHLEDEAPMTRSIAVGVGEIGVNEQGWFGSTEPGEHSDTSIHVTNTALQQLNMAAFQSRHLRISNEQLQQVLALMLKKNLRSVGVQCRFATVDRAVSAVGNADGTGVNQVTVGCSDDRIDVDVVPMRQWRSIGVDNRPSVFHRACGADAVYRVDSATNTRTQGIRLERATNTDSVLKYPAATNTDPAPHGESVSTETETGIFHKISALSDVTTNTDEPYSSSSVQSSLSSQQVIVRSGTKARSTDNRTSRDLLTLGVLPSDSNVVVSSSVTSLSSSVPVRDNRSSPLAGSMPVVTAGSADVVRSAADIVESSYSSSLPQVNITSRTISAPAVTEGLHTSTEVLDGSVVASRDDVLSTTSAQLIDDREPVESSEGSVDTLCSVVLRGDTSSENCDPEMTRRVWTTHSTVTRGVRSAPADISILPHASHLVFLDQEGNIFAEGSDQRRIQTTVGPATSIKVYETTTEIRRSGPHDDGSVVTSSASDGQVITSRDGDGSLRSIMKSSSASPVARRRKEISFVDSVTMTR
jgi:hypothetical protein